MSEQRGRDGQVKQGGSILGSLREALAAAGREDPSRQSPAPAPATAATNKDEASAPIPLPAPEPKAATQVAMPAAAAPQPTKSATEAVREARGGTPNIPPADRHIEASPPTTRVVKSAAAPAAAEPDAARTRIVRGRQKVERGAFKQDPVVGWVVIVGGPGIGAFRPIFEGNNTLGRAPTNRIAIDFGDDAISAEEQAYIRYDSADRSFLFVPNLAKTNVVSVNDKRPTAAVSLAAMDLITMGRTQLVFVPFCGTEFDWGELAEMQS